jgi:hypothetical protein
MNNVESVERLAKLVKRLNPDQFVSVDVESLVHLLTAHKMLEKLPDAVKQQYLAGDERGITVRRFPDGYVGVQGESRKSRNKG